MSYKQIFNKDYWVITESEYKSFVFSGGEVHVELYESTISDLKELDPKDFNILIDVRITNSEKLMEVVILNDILKRHGFKTSLMMAYIPYARQDRVTIPYGAFSLKVFANIINSCEFLDVFVLDPHSTVSQALFNNIKLCNTNKLIEVYLNYLKINPKKLVLLSPDLGAIKRVESFREWLQRKSPYYGINIDIIIANKHRNPKTGKISGIDIIGNIPKNSEILVIDDIADGAASFIELLDKTGLNKENNVHLWTTHGIFSKGDKIVYKAGYKTIGTTDSVRKDRTGLDIDRVYMLSCDSGLYGHDDGTIL